MNEALATIIGASAGDRRGLFLTAAIRIGTAVQNVEKDFWGCWVLDALFNGLEPGGPRLLFKGGTSLSKAFGLISRFSEDIDVTVFRDDLGQGVNIAELDGISGKQRRIRLNRIREACQQYVNGPLIAELTGLAAIHVGEGRFRLEKDPDDPDGQTLLFWYPTVTESAAYIRSAVKIELGAKSALDPNISAVVRPYVAEDTSGLDLAVGNITTVRPERTLWDKIAILHGLRQWHARRGELRHGGQRVSRHYYDVYRIAQTTGAHAWLADRALGADCVRHARLFFGSRDLGLNQATPGSFSLVPGPDMCVALEQDYTAMAGMIFGAAPSLDHVLATITDVERAINETR